MPRAPRKKPAGEAAAKKAPAKPRKKKVEPGSMGLAATEVTTLDPPANVAELVARITADGGTPMATYREPFGANWVVFAALPIERVAPTPYQRQLSEAHAKRLAAVIPKVGRFLDPLVAMPAPDGYWTPNGMHRLDAMNRLGAKAITALVVPDPEVAYRILALNTEKAHNLKDKSLEVVRMAAALAEGADTGKLPESTWAFEFEEPGYLTIGHCYEQSARFSGGAYMPVVKRCDEFFEESIADSIPTRKARAARLLELDGHVDACVKALKDAGFTSGYLKPFVVARLNPLRFVKSVPGKAAVAEFDATMDKMIDKAKSFDAKKVKPQDLAATGGSGGDEE